MSEFISFLTYFGITADKITPLVVCGVIAMTCVFKHTKPIRQDLKDIRERFFSLEGRMTSVFQSKSPVSLLPKGESILISSGMRAYIDSNIDHLMKKCEGNNPYDIQEAAFGLFDNMQFPENITDQIKDIAFKEGTSVDIIRRISGIYFRDKCLERCGFKPEDLDKPRS